MGDSITRLTLRLDKLTDGYLLSIQEGENDITTHAHLDNVACAKHAINEIRWVFNQNWTFDIIEEADNG